MIRALPPGPVQAEQEGTPATIAPARKPSAGAATSTRRGTPAEQQTNEDAKDGRSCHACEPSLGESAANFGGVTGAIHSRTNSSGVPCDWRKFTPRERPSKRTFPAPRTTGCTVSWTMARPVVIGLLLVALVFVGLAVSFFLLKTSILD